MPEVVASFGNGGKQGCPLAAHGQIISMLIVRDVPQRIPAAAIGWTIIHPFRWSEGSKGWLRKLERLAVACGYQKKTFPKLRDAIISCLKDAPFRNIAASGAAIHRDDFGQKEIQPFIFPVEGQAADIF